MATRGQSAAKASVGYTLGNVLVRGISFISMPIFARLLTVADYGIYDTYNAYINIFTIIIGYALHMSIKNANIDYEGKVNKYTSSITLIILFSSVFWLILAAIFRNPLSKALSLDQPYLVILIVIESLGIAMITFYNSYLAIEYRYKEYLILSLVFAVLGIGLSIILIVTLFTETRYLGRVFGTVAASTAVAVYILFRLYKGERPTFNKEYWKYGLRIGLPLIPHGLSQILLNQFDRVMIKNIIGNAEAGLYSFAYNILTIFNVITASIQTAYEQWFFDQMREGNTARIRKVSTIYAGVVGIFVTALYLIAPEFTTIFGGMKYEESKYVVFPILLAGFYGFMYYFPSTVEYYHKKTKMIAVATMIAAGLNVVLNLIFIPRYGYVAAAYTTVVCYLIYYVIHVIFARRVQKSFLFNMKAHIGITAAVTVLAFACLLAVELRWLRLGVFAAGLVAAVIFAIVRKDLTKMVIGIFLKK